MKGTKKEKSLIPSRLRLSVTLDIMAKIRRTLNDNPHDYDNIMLWAASCIKLPGFLRCSEFIVPSQSDVCPDLTLQDLSIDSRLNSIRIQVTNTNPFHRGHELCIGITGSSICPISAMLPYLAARGPHPGPLFIISINNYHIVGNFVGIMYFVISRWEAPGLIFATGSPDLTFDTLCILTTLLWISELQS